MFDLLDRPLHWISVKWPTLVTPETESDLSKPGFNEVDLRVELIDRNEVLWRLPGFFFTKDDAEDDATRAEIKAKFDGKDPPPVLETFLHVVKEWRGISSRGKRVPLNEENAAILLLSPLFETAFGVAYVNAIGGRVMEREKNSDGSPNGGPEEAAKPEPPVSTKTVNDSE